VGNHYPWTSIKECGKPTGRKESMRQIRKEEKKQRGCDYCENVIPPNVSGKAIRQCPYDECPYHELDEAESYNEYLKKYGDVNIGKFLLKLLREEQR
jgi:hypothetical protein